MLCNFSGFSKILPVIVASLILGCREELASLTHTAGAVDCFSSFCRHSSVETLQRWAGPLFNSFLTTIIIHPRCAYHKQVICCIWCERAFSETHVYRLLTNHASRELRDVFDVEGVYVLEPDEDNDFLLRVTLCSSIYPTHFDHHLIIIY
jgi:hypothetical protein